jgi:hypothetical protein
MARFLAIGNLNAKNPTDIRFFFPNPDVEFLNTGPGPDVFGLQKRSAGQIAKDALSGRFEFIFAGNNVFPYPNPRKNFFRNYSNLIWKVLKHPNLLAGGRFPYSKVGTCLVGIDTEDRPVVDNRFFQILDRSICFFKRELPQNPCNSLLYTSARTEDNANVLNDKRHQAWIKKMRPISLGLPSALHRRYSTLELPKKVDVFFAGDTKNRPNRIHGLKQLEQLKQEGVSVDIAQERLSHDDFFQRCAQARIVWSPEGFGWDCFRHYEVALVGAVPLMQSPTIQRYAPMVDGEHALYYYVEGDALAIRIRQALQNRARLAEMGRAARRHVLQWHTHEAINQYVIEETRRTVSEKTERP